MAMASDSTQTLQSGRNSVAVEITALGDAATSAVGIISPRPRRRGFGRGKGTVSSPRTQTIRGGDSESLLSFSSSSTASVDNVGIVVDPLRSPPLAGVDQDQTRHISTCETAETLQKSNENVRDGNNAVKNQAWNHPSDCATEASPVMDALSWPALSKSTLSSAKSSSDMLRTLAEGSVSAAQGTGIASPSSPGPNSATKHAQYNRQRSMRHGGDNLTNNVSANGGLSDLPSPWGTHGDLAPNSSGEPDNSAKDSSPRVNVHLDDRQRRGSGSPSNSGNEHQQHWNSFRRGDWGRHPRGNGSRHHGYGGKHRDQDRGNQDWNVNRNFAGRSTNIQQRRVPTGPFYGGPPFPTSGPVIFPNMPGYPFGGPFVYPDVPSPAYSVPGPHLDLYRTFHPVHPMVPVLYPFPDPQLNAKIVSQIDYYFSNENLVKDTYLRKNMDAQGWVSIKLIASFKKVMQLTDNIPLILDALRSSVVVEVEGEKVRRRNDWLTWLISPSVSYSTLSSSESSEDMLSANLQSTVLNDLTEEHGTGDTFHSRSSS